MWQKIRNELNQGKTFLQFGSLQTFSHVITNLTPLVAAKLFSKDLFGRYSLSETIIFFFVAFLITSTQNPFIVHANRERTGSGKINKSFTAQTILLLIGVLVSLATGIIFRKPLMIFARISSTELIFLSLGFLGITFKDFIGNLFMALNERIKRTLFDVTFGCTALLCIFIFHLINWVNLKSFFLAYFISSILVFFIFVRTINFKLLLPFEFDKRRFTEMFHFTKWLTLGAGSAYLIHWGNNFILRYFVPLEEIGVYALAYKFFKGFGLLVYIIPTYFLPFISKNINNSEKIRAYLSTKRPKIFLLGITALIILFLIIPYFLALIYQDKFAGSVLILRILLVPLALLLYKELYAPIFSALKKYKFPQIAIIIHAALNLALNIILVPRFGIQGAATATAFSYLPLALSYKLYFRLKIKRLLGLVK